MVRSRVRLLLVFGSVLAIIGRLSHTIFFFKPTDHGLGIGWNLRLVPLVLPCSAFNLQERKYKIWDYVLTHLKSKNSELIDWPVPFLSMTRS